MAKALTLCRIGERVKSGCPGASLDVTAAGSHRLRGPSHPFRMGDGEMEVEAGEGSGDRIAGGHSGANTTPTAGRGVVLVRTLAGMSG